MTTAGKIFKAYAEAIVKKHGFGSSKMVKTEDARWLSSEMTKLSQMIAWDQDKEAAKKALNDLGEAGKWLIQNGWLRKRDAQCSRSTRYGSYVKHYTVTVEYYGLTEKGWAVAQKYLEA